MLILLAACGGTRYRTELVGHGNGMVSTRASVTDTDLVAAPGAGGIQLPQGNYELAMRFEVPRAQLVTWKIVCPGVSIDGQAGETFEQYRERRIGELRRDREEQRARAQAAANLVVGAVTPRARVGNADVRAHVELRADVNEVIELPPGDLGRGSFVASARVMTVGDGVCALHVSADDADVRAAFTVTRIRDLNAEQRMRTIAAREVAVKTRGQLTAQLVTSGADPAVHQARLDAEAARASAQADVRARLEATAIYARQEYLAFLSGKCNAQPGGRDRAAEEERARREARLVAYAEIAQRRDQAALQARATIRAQLIALGAKGRPPMPQPKPEDPGTPPFDGAEWTAGYWSWESGGWAWQDGGWSDPSLFGETGSGVTVGVGVGASHTYQTGTRDHRRNRDHVREHRDVDPPKWDARARDKGSSSSESSRTRDHRDESRAVWTSKDADKGAAVRDHRKDDDKKQDDDKPRVRDHR